MEFRLEEMGDLPQIKAVYREIIRDMEEKGIAIWDEIYPCEFFEADIADRRLYVLMQGGEILSAFALMDANAGESAISWQTRGKPLYIDRFGVNAAYARRGIGRWMLQKARETARTLGAESLRLFVVDENLPAIRLYEKSGFVRAEGCFDEVIDEDTTLREYGYETAL